MKLRRAAVEFLVILLGVLGALWVEDYRDWRSARAHEQAALEGIANDLEGDIEELARVTAAAHRRATGAVAVILHLDQTAAQQFKETGWPEARVDTAMAMSVRTAFSEARVVNDFDHANAAYRELLATGRLETVRTPEVRRAIGAYYQLAEDTNDFTEPDLAVQAQLDGLFIENGIHRFLSELELGRRIASDERIEASLYRVANSAFFYSLRMARLAESAQALQDKLGAELGRD